MDMMRWLAGVYVNALNAIHYMHDKYSYERIQMALHDEHVHRWFATGIAGLSVVADSLSAIKYAKVRVVRDETGLVTDYITEGDFPKYGNDDDYADNWLLLLMTFMLMKLLNILIHVMEEVLLEEFVIQEHLLSQPT